MKRVKNADYSDLGCKESIVETGKNAEYSIWGARNQYLPLLWGFTLTDIQTRKDNFTMKCIVEAAIFEDSVSGMITVAVDKINKMAECGFPRLEVNEVGFAGFLLILMCMFS